MDRRLQQPPNQHQHKHGPNHAAIAAGLGGAVGVKTQKADEGARRLSQNGNSALTVTWLPARPPDLEAFLWPPLALSTQASFAQEWAQREFGPRKAGAQGKR